VIERSVWREEECLNDLSGEQRKWLSLGVIEGLEKCLVWSQGVK
jgi:hypothetical protein